jgi:hypothetical protein
MVRVFLIAPEVIKRLKMRTVENIINAEAGDAAGIGTAQSPTAPVGIHKVSRKQPVNVGGRGIVEISCKDYGIR